MIEEFAAAQQKRLQEKIQQYAEIVVDGASKDYAAYRETCGVIRGLRLAEQSLAELVEIARRHNETTF